MVGPRKVLIGSLAALAATLLHPEPARADLAADADRLARAWKARGAEVERLDPMFLDHGKSKRLDLAAKDAKGQDLDCLSIAVLGAHTTDFSVAPDPLAAPTDEPDASLPSGHPMTGGLADRSVRSAVGAASMIRCGPKRRELQRLLLDMRSPRGALEVVIARSPAPLGDMRDLLPERAFGPIAPRGNPGRPIEPGPLVERVAHAEQRARTERAKFNRVPMLSSPEGAGEFLLRLESGCHRLDLMADVPGVLPRRATDLDAEARTGEGRVLARDRGEAADARLDFCIGETMRVSIPYGGAAGPVMVVAADASWPIPSAIPVHWGARPRAGFAMALRRRHAPEPSSAPVAESLGSAGSTMVPVAVEPGRCYLAAVAIARGEPRGLRITAAVGDRYARDEVGERGDGAALAFCAESEDVARIEVEARGEGIWWTFALWPLGGSP
ncbi:hypothetical protein [Polyangium aurulentum]|uniref:hypothetical protein n=1 Tax=Polyangium aurulentum TaxID=2567896 RepID=UPI0010ADDAAB|nr:hypothetical protein [Polyangium aurulentum]UQA63387.1 hypothetical protein E8A73_024125 [Polyangium aurulentum]